MVKLLKKKGTNDPTAGSINSIEKGLVFEHRPLILNMKKINIVAINIRRETILVENTLLQTILPIKNGCKNTIWLSIYKNFYSFSSCSFSYWS
jgi:hypothetical protein